MAQPAPQRSGIGPVAMPPPRTNHAPHFSGQVGDPIEDFLREYEEFADSCSLTDRQKAETVIRYIPLFLRDFWKSQNGYAAGDWTGLKRELLDIYDDTSAHSRHSRQKLVEFVRRSVKLHMRDEEDVQNYYRQSIVLSKPLLDSHHLTIDERNKAFWLGFHNRDRNKMYARLIANNPYQPAREHFDYLDVYKVARATFSGDHLLDLDEDDPWEEPQGIKDRHSERARERRLEERSLRQANSSRQSYERRRHRSPTDLFPRESRHSDPRFSPSPESYYRRSDTRRSPTPNLHYRRSDTRRTLPVDVETKVVRFKEPLREEEEREVDDLMRRMRGLSVHEESYAMLYVRCALRFPSVAQVLPKPLLTQQASTHVPATTFSVQTAPAPPPPPARQSWPAAANPLPTPQSNPSSFFRSRVRPDGCTFCLLPGHRVRRCSSAQEYVRLGRALVRDDRLRLPNGQPTPNDGAGRGLKHGIDAWLAA
ncbi:hypothetical protein V8E52_004838 [Russula decolorans]|jgi:hypothetical protein